MDTKLVGFIGKDCYDLVYIVARTAHLLGSRCAVADLSGEGIAAIIGGASGNKSGSVAENRGVDYYAGVLPKGDYTYVFIYFGWHSTKIFNCEEMYIVTDCQKQDLDKLKRIPASCGNYRTLIMRSNADLQKKKEFVLQHLSNLALGDTACLLNFGAADEEIRLSILYESLPSLKRLSDGIKNFVMTFFLVDYDRKAIREAVKNLVKGK